MDSWKIQKATGPVSYVVLLADGSTVRRHVDNIKARHITNNINTIEEDSVDYLTLQQPSNETSTEATSDTTQMETITLVTTSTPDNAAAPELVISTRPSRV